MTRDDVRLMVDEITAHADVAGFDSLREAEKPIALAWRGTGMIGNGGFRYYYEQFWDMPTLAAAFESLGLPEVANACRRSMKQFPGGEIPKDERERNRLLDQIDDELFADDESVVFDLGLGAEKLLDAIGSYVEAVGLRKSKRNRPSSSSWLH